MTQVAIISDVHAGVRALADALAKIERLGCDEIGCAGDLLDWGLFPMETLALVRDRRIPTIRGNHDRWAMRDGRDDSGWDLTPAAIHFLSALPESWSRTIDGVRVAFWHARPGSDMDGIYPDASSAELAEMLDRAECDVLAVGHTHVPFALRVGTRLVCNPGAVLRSPAQPMDGTMLFDRESGKFAPARGPGGGTFGILDLPSLRFTVHDVVDGRENDLDQRGERERDTQDRSRP